MASIQIPEARVLMITPFDKSILQDVEKAIMASDIGISPTNDGNVIRLVIPQLTEERRKELAKDVKKKQKMQKSRFVTSVVMRSMNIKTTKMVILPKMICAD